MGPVNNILNRIDALNDQNVSPFKKAVQSRATNLFITTPTELAQVIKNTFLTPVHFAGAILKTATKAVVFITGSETLKKFEAKLPGFNDLLRTIANIFAYAIGACSSATLGVLSPKANFKLHCALGVAINQRQAEINTALAKQKAAEAQLHLELTGKEELTADEQELLNNLTLAFAMAKDIETEVKQATQAAVDLVNSSPADNTSVLIEKTSDKNGDQTTIVQYEEKYDIDDNDEKEYVIESIDTYETSFGQILNSAFETGKDFLSKTYSAITTG